MKQIGNLFILRININLVGSILDSPVSFFPYCEDTEAKLTDDRNSSGRVFSRRLTWR
jgi:hypothetical protein